mmetsp:Transcript_4901/g.4153  ORF Transcript_4901/g.4153 Transcript_4901/m.4153 type:complete len:190 (-) Transcript_4901:33-602(-)
MNSFRCDTNTRHVVCSACKNAFPLTNKPMIHVQCVCCKNYFCHQHWKCRNVARNKVSSLENVPFVGISQDCLNKNQYEQRVLKDYVNSQGMNNLQLKNDIFDKCTNDGNWEITDGLGNKRTLAKDTSICRDCYPKTWSSVLYNYRKSIKNDLPVNVKTRQDCWYGKGCRTQTHNYGHAAKLNHICDARR